VNDFTDEENSHINSAINSVRDPEQKLFAVRSYREDDDQAEPLIVICAMVPSDEEDEDFIAVPMFMLITDDMKIHDPFDMEGEDYDTADGSPV